MIVAPEPEFYAPWRHLVPGEPGSLIEKVELEAPAGTRGWAILYRSVAVDGRPIAVSGLVMGPASGPVTALTGLRARPVVAWAHGTTGIADSCAPSRLGMAALDTPALVGLARLGVVVVATDYEGLGTPGLHPYLVGESEGRSILDSVRAARSIRGTGLATGSRTVIAGVSQGGHAALWAGELASSWAPDIRLEGVLAASPPIHLQVVQRTVLEATEGEAAAVPAAEGELSTRAVSWLEALLVVAAWHDTYGDAAPIDGLLTDEAVAIMATLREAAPWTTPPPVANPFLVDPRSSPAWQALLERNSPGHRAVAAPVLILAATSDVQVPPASIEPGVERLRAAGTSVELRWIDGGHTATVTEPAALAMAARWMAERLR